MGDTLTTIFVSGLVSLIVSILASLVLERRKENREHQENLYAPLHRELGKIEHNILYFRDSFPTNVWFSMGEKNITFRIKPDQLRFDLEDFYNNTLHNFQVGWQLVQEHIVKQIQQKLNIPKPKDPAELDQYLNWLAKEIFCPLGNSQEYTYLLGSFARFKTLTNVSYASGQDMIDVLKKLLKDDPFIKSERENHQKTLREAQRLMVILAKKIGLKERPFKSVL